MKRTGSALFMAVFFSGVLYAADVRLSLEQSNYPSPSGVYSNRWIIERNGNVILEKYGSGAEKLAQLPASKMEQLEQDIERARSGQIVDRPDFCLAVPTRSYEYTADNGKIMLRSGASPCGGNLLNDSPAANTLVKELDAISRNVFTSP